MRSPEDELLDQERAASVLELFALGQTVREIADVLALDVRTVNQIISKRVDEIRADNLAFVETAYLKQSLGLDVLIQRCMEAIKRAAEAKPVPLFDEKAVKCLIMVYDRQAKLHGLDKTKKVGNKSGLYEWLETASQAELIGKAAEMGITLPEPFAVA